MKKFIKENWFKLILSVVLTIISISVLYYYLYYLPKKVGPEQQFTLSEKCQKSGKEFFNKNYVSDLSVELQQNTTFTTHYNKSGKCFLLEEQNVSYVGYSNFHSELYDVIDNKLYAEYNESIFKDGHKRIDCIIPGKLCDTKDEFTKFINNYLER